MESRDSYKKESPRRSTRKRARAKPPSPPEAEETNEQGKVQSKAPPAAAKPKKRRQKEPEQKKYVTKFRSKDVLKGRGPVVNRHRGNIAFRNRAKSYIPRYTQADKTGKTKICQEIVEACQAEGIRFLQKEEDPDDRWFHITQHTARTKAAQTIQDIIKRRDKDGGDPVVQEDEDEVTSSSQSEDDESQGSEADEAEEKEKDDSDHDDEEGNAEEEKDEGDEALKLPAISAGSASFGSEAGPLHLGLSEVAFPHEGENASDSDGEEKPTLRRPEAQLRPAAVPYYQRQLSIEHAQDETGSDSLQDDSEKSE